MGHIKSMTP